MSFELLTHEVEEGLAGRSSGIPMGFRRISKHIGIRKATYFLIGGNTGSGKTSFLDNCFVLNPYDWYISPENKTDVKLRIIYRSMERNRIYKLAKWVGRKIFLDYGIIIPISKLLGWTEKMTKDEHDLYLLYKDYISNMLEVVTIIDGAENPVGVAKDLRAHALENGREEQIDKFNKIYIPNDEHVVTLVIVDHIGLLKGTKDLTTKKMAIDKLSSEMQYARDFYKYVPVLVSQFNRDISNPIRIKAGDIEPNLEDFKESSTTQEDCDICVALFDPIRYKVQDTSGYNLEKLKDEHGNKYFRSLRVLKNGYGADDLRVGLAFLGELGIFKELPKKQDITDEDYESVTNKSYFLNQ